MAFINYKNTNNVVAQLAVPLSSMSTTMQLLTGQGLQFLRIPGIPTDPLNYPFFLTLEQINTISTVKVVVKREIIRVTSVSGDIFTIVRGAGTCVGDDSIQPPVQGNTSYNFDIPSQSIVSQRVTAEDLKDIKDRVAEFDPIDPADIMDLTTDQTVAVGIVKTFPTNPRQGTYIAPTLGDQYVPKQYVDDTVVTAATPKNLAGFPVMAGENLVSKDSTFSEEYPTFAESTTPHSVGELTANMRVFALAFSSGFSGSSVIIKINKFGVPSPAFELRYVNEVAGQPGNPVTDLAHPNAIGTISEASISGINNYIINFLGPVVIPRGQKVYPLLRQVGDVVNAANYYIVYSANKNTTIRRMGFFDGSGYVNRVAKSFTRAVTNPGGVFSIANKGVGLTTTKNGFFLSISRMPGTANAPTRAFLQNGAGVTLVGPLSFVGDIAALPAPYRFTSGQTYRITFDQNGGTFQGGEGGTGGYPISTDGLNFTTGIFNGAGTAIWGCLGTVLYKTDDVIGGSSDDFLYIKNTDFSSLSLPAPYGTITYAPGDLRFTGVNFSVALSGTGLNVYFCPGAVISTAVLYNSLGAILEQVPISGLNARFTTPVVAGQTYSISAGNIGSNHTAAFSTTVLPQNNGIINLIQGVTDAVPLGSPTLGGVNSFNVMKIEIVGVALATIENQVLSKTDIDFLHKTAFYGLSSTNYTAGQDAITIKQGEINGFVGLTLGARYYLDNIAGGLTTVPNNYYVGIAKNSTTLVLGVNRTDFQNRFLELVKIQGVTNGAAIQSSVPHSSPLGFSNPSAAIFVDKILIAMVRGTCTVKPLTRGRIEYSKDGVNRLVLQEYTNEAVNGYSFTLDTYPSSCIFLTDPMTYYRLNTFHNFYTVGAGGQTDTRFLLSS